MIQGIKVAHSAPSISHMFLADDCYIFCKATTVYTNTVQAMLRIFKQASGQQVNIDKSAITFSKNACSSLESDLCKHLGFMEARENSMYLGLLAFINRKKTVIFGYN